MAEFFTGYRTVESFTITENKGKRVLECKIVEKWEPIIHDTAKCGASITCKLVRRVGLKKADKEVLENFVKGSIGIKGFARLEEQVKEQVSSEIVWDIAIEEERTVVFPSPQYGRYTALQYQKKRFYDLRYQDKRWLHKDSWQHSICEHTNYFHDDSKKIDSDPACNPPSSGFSDYDGLFHVDLVNTSMLVGFNRSDKGIKIDFAGKKVNAKSSGNTSFIANLPKGLIPESLIFLGNITTSYCKANFSPYQEPSIEIPIEGQELSELISDTSDISQEDIDYREIEV